MPITLRARPTCHYCGKRNSPSQNQRKFTCQYCHADNYLDESGQITDVPASTTTTPKQYAIPVTPAFENSDDSIFCSTCLKNQYMYNAALSEYLPDPDHPEYDRFEAAIPAFKKDLERRYPTCCARCEPKVKAQLHQATYNARSDHVRRVLDRSKQRRNTNTWGWRSLLVNAAGLGWLISLLVQMLWHILGSQTHGDVLVPNMRPEDCLATWPVPVQCSVMMEQLIGPSLILGVFCMWWNPKWQHKLEGREGRLVGLDKFYKVQGLLLVLRFTSWVVVKDVPSLQNQRTILHAVSVVLTTMIAGWLRFNIIQIYKPQIVDWSRDPAPLLDSKQYVPLSSPAQDISPPDSQQNVPVGVFNTSTPRVLQSWRPPTPPVDEDAMEWDPTPVAFNPDPKKISYKSMEPTPFHGTLPAFPRGGIYQSKVERAVEQPKAIGLPPGFFDKSHGKRVDERHTKPIIDNGLAQPKFFPDMARADTGLENIFDKIFSLHDGSNVPKESLNTDFPTTLPTLSSNSGSTPYSTPMRLSKVGRIYNILAALSLAALALLFWSQQIPGPIMLVILTIVPILDVALHVLQQLWTKTIGIDSVRIGVSCLEGFAIFLLYISQPRGYSLVWHKVVLAATTLLLIQELYSYCVADVLIQSFSPEEVVVSEEVELMSQPPQKAEMSLQPTSANHPSVRRMSSDESIASTASIKTTSTASGWKTPVRNHREELRNGAGSTSYGLGALSLKNDHSFGLGNSVAGPRNRITPARQGRNNW